MVELPAEKGLSKVCRNCGRRLPVSAFYPTKKQLTADGRRVRMSRCSVCFNRARPDRSTRKRAREQAKRRARTRLVEMYPEVFDRLLEEELALVAEDVR